MPRLHPDGFENANFLFFLEDKHDLRGSNTEDSHNQNKDNHDPQQRKEDHLHFVQEQILKYQFYAESEYKLLQWMIGFNLAFTMAMLWKVLADVLLLNSPLKFSCFMG